MPYIQVIENGHLTNIRLTAGVRPGMDGCAPVKVWPPEKMQASVTVFNKRQHDGHWARDSIGMDEKVSRGGRNGVRTARKRHRRPYKKVPTIKTGYGPRGTVR